VFGARRVVGVVVAAEAAAVILFMLRPAYGYLLAVALLSVLIAGIVRAIRTRRPVECRCFGAGGRRPDRTHIVRNGLLAGIAVAGLISGQLATITPSLAMAGIAVAGGVSLGLVFVHWTT
jgi:Methylamine utilisation protein MauE